MIYLLKLLKITFATMYLVLLLQYFKLIYHHHHHHKI